MISVIVPSKITEENIVSTVLALHRHLSFRFPGGFEIIVVPNPIPLGHQLSDYVEPLQELLHFSEKHKEVRIIPHHGKAGKYAAIKTGVQASTGAWIFITDADLPFELSFFDEAAQKLRADFDFVVGNRRHPDSMIRTPQKLLKKLLMRDRIGRVFNLGVRLLFPSIPVRDTQAGIKAMTRRFANHAFQLQICPGFYGDIELFLIAVAHSYRYTSLPVIFNYGENKSSIRFFREFFVALGWLSKIFVRDFLGTYEVSLGLSEASTTAYEEEDSSFKRS
ncbi:MAG: putative glycosyltransferase [Bacteriovoracaceae bacterium]|nr:putative glycosyltransferase [Bacteriovoracaceae bacterium]